MANTGIAHFDRTVQKTNELIGEVMDEAGIDSKEKAYIALRGTLQELRDRLTVTQVAKLGAQLPMLVRGFYYEGWDPQKVPVKVSQGYVFASRVHSHLQNDPQYDPERVVRGVLDSLSRRISGGQREDVKAELPDDIARFWPL